MFNSNPYWSSLLLIVASFVCNNFWFGDHTHKCLGLPPDSVLPAQITPGSAQITLFGLIPEKSLGDI